MKLGLDNEQTRRADYEIQKKEGWGVSDKQIWEKINGLPANVDLPWVGWPNIYLCVGITY